MNLNSSFEFFLAVAALPANQQANFLQLHLRDAALRFFQTLPMAIRQILEPSITALRDRFCNPQLQELHVLKLENMKFDSKTDTPENFLVTLQTKATKAYPDPDPPVVAPIGPHAADAAVEQTRFDQVTVFDLYFIINFEVPEKKIRLFSGVLFS